MDNDSICTYSSFVLLILDMNPIRSDVLQQDESESEAPDNSQQDLHDEYEKLFVEQQQREHDLREAQKQNHAAKDE